uniref:RasGEF domain family member 1B n=1 Tax=Propithecus coquereli TaxID=379532 RepID=A0A2K6FMV4_PROCO
IFWSCPPAACTPSGPVCPSPLIESMPQTPPFSAMFDSSGYNRNLYQSAEDSCGGLYYHDNNLLSGSLEALIQHLVPNVDYYPDVGIHIPLKLALFVIIYLILTELDLLFLPQNQIRKIAPKILQLLTEWTETFPYDFRDERMMRNLKDLAHRIASGEEQTYRKNVQQMMQGLIRKLAALSQYEEVLAKISSTSTDRLTVLKTKPQSIQRDIITVCSDPYTLAQQLTHVELERLNYIGPEEFVQAFVQKDPLDNDKSCYSERKKTRNLEAYVEWFNRLSYLVATEICMPVKKKHRARMIEYFIDVARECFNIGNFNSLMAIISGMNMSPVSRLKKTWAKVKTAKFDILEHQMDPSSNFYNYRTALRGAAQRSLTAHSSREKVCAYGELPCCSHLNPGSNSLPRSVLRCFLYYPEFNTWDLIAAAAAASSSSAPCKSSRTLYLASYESEGPENHIEKDRWKSLR